MDNFKRGEIKDGFYVADDGVYEIIRRGDGWNTSKKIIPKEIFVEAVIRYLNMTISSIDDSKDDSKDENKYINKYQEVIEHIDRNLLDGFSKPLVIGALEKQIPKKVISNGKVYFCPCCKGSVWQNADESNFCFRCGQAIDWSE